MRLLKSEIETRWAEGRDGGRTDTPMHPEALCDHDIMLWRGELNWSRTIEANTAGVDAARANDYDAPSRDPNNRLKSYSKVRNLIHRTFV